MKKTNLAQDDLVNNLFRVMSALTLYSLCFGNLSSLDVATISVLWIILILSLNIVHEYEVYGGIDVHGRGTFLNIHLMCI